jgi:hypothetical protein
MFDKDLGFFYTNKIYKQIDEVIEESKYEDGEAPLT